MVVAEEESEVEFTLGVRRVLAAWSGPHPVISGHADEQEATARQLPKKVENTNARVCKLILIMLMEDRWHM